MLDPNASVRRFPNARFAAGEKEAIKVISEMLGGGRRQRGQGLVEYALILVLSTRGEVGRSRALDRLQMERSSCATFTSPATRPSSYNMIGRSRFSIGRGNRLAGSCHETDRAASASSCERHSRFDSGQLVQGMCGWQDYAVVSPVSSSPTPVPPGVSIEAALSVLGLNGLTAYFGLLEIGRPQPG